MSTHKLLKEIHRIGWGKAWPQTTYTISRKDVLPLADETDSGMEINNINNDEDEEPIPERTNFNCLCNIDLLQDAFCFRGKFLPYIVILEEYEFLRQLLENSDRPFIVTGHMGTGKTVFLLYLLIYRIARQLPTAVQFSSYEYFAFIPSGAYICPIGYGDTINHRKMPVLPQGCWCLSDDTNADVTVLCHTFGRRGLRQFLITPPRLDQYQEWRTQTLADTVITALPQTVELAAIAGVWGLDPRQAVSLVNKWGPSIRSMLNILEYGEHEEKNLERSAVCEAIAIYHEPSKARDIGSSEGSTLLCVCRKNSFDYGDSKLTIPTVYLSELFDSICQSLSSDERFMENVTVEAVEKSRRNKSLVREIQAGKLAYKI